MTFVDFMEQVEKVIKENTKTEGINERQINRNYLLALNKYDFSEKEKRIGCMLAVGITDDTTPFEVLKEKIYRYYMLDIGNEEKIEIKDTGRCYFNLKNGTLATTKASPFDDNETDVLIEDIRTYAGIGAQWWQIAQDEDFHILETAHKIIQSHKEEERKK